MQKVIEVSKKYLPSMASGFSSPKLTQYIGDGFEYMKEHENEFDIVITDSSDPVGMFPYKKSYFSFYTCIKNYFHITVFIHL